MQPADLVDSTGMTGETTGRARAWPLLIVVAAGIVAYLNSFAGVFVLDDVREIVESDGIRSFSSLWGSRAVVRASLAANYALGGLEPAGYHAFNLIVHLLAGVTLFAIVRRVVGVWPALAAALIWVVHPLQTQSVTYVIQRAESMTGLLYLLTIYGVLRCARSTRPRRWAALAIGACAVGMLTKPVIATAPIVAILFDWTIVTGRWRDVWRHRWALHAGLLATVPLLVLTGTVGKVLATESEHLRTAGLAFDGCTPWQYLLTQSGVILHYLRLTIWPAPLCLDYAWPFAASFGAVAVPFTVVTLLFAACVAALWLRPAAGFLGVAFFVILAPTSSVLPIADAAVEHRMYLPLACVVVGIVLATRRLLANLPEPRRLAVGGVATGLVAVVLTACTLQRNRDYHDAMAMWQTVIECRPENPRAYNELGNLLAARDDMATATGCYEVAAKLMPTEPLFVSNAANACLQLDRVDDAIRYGQLALRAREDYQPAHNILGSAFVARGSVDEGIRHLREAVRLDPDDPWARCNLGRVLALASGVSRSGGPVDETLLEAGVVELNETLRRHPGFPDAVNVLTHIRRLRERGPQRAAAASE